MSVAQDLRNSPSHPAEKNRAPGPPLTPTAVVSRTYARRGFALQGIYYALTGIWPLLHIRSFLAVTGEKTDLWLVKTVGALVAATGVVLLRESQASEPSRSLAGVAACQAVALMAVDVFYVANGIIAPIYLADALAEGILVGFWWYLLRRLDRPSGSASF